MSKIIDTRLQQTNNGYKKKTQTTWEVIKAFHKGFLCSQSIIGGESGPPEWD